MKKSASTGWSKKKFSGEWAQTLKKYLSRQQDEVPKGWVRAETATRLMGYKSNHTGGSINKLLNSMVRDGVLLKKDFRIFDASGRRVSPIAHYKIS